MHAFEAYSRAVLAYRLGDGGGTYRTRPASPESMAVIVRQAARAGHCVLLGVGSGQAARYLAESLPEGVGFTVCELFPEQARAFGDGLPLLADDSAVALAWMLFSVGLCCGRAACALNPELDDTGARMRFQAMQKLHAAFSPLEAPAAPSGKSMSVAAILRPDEPDLEGFFAALPGCASEAVVVWDADRVPENPPTASMPVTHLARRLGNDFAAQRNRMLDACRGDWVLYLDGDERLDPALAALLPSLPELGGCGSFAFPRLGLTPAGVKVGWGLWPDLQVRLFRRAPDVRFVRPVHERLEGVSGPTGLVVGASIRHLSDLTATPESLARKHAVFDAAGGFSGLHRRNPEYPVLPEAFFASLSPRPVVGMWPQKVGFAPL
ncbi:hypothetical protein [Fundidesulfovibrio terrae]|uniref:hypothetical protein n=1 Tax=Fundidesulfovibrio terrae TaxID=2922866 RepID=UPI001FAF94FC|nr:hypothetical protein [Fundidesulfovibrio terrae]